MQMHVDTSYMVANYDTCVDLHLCPTCSSRFQIGGLQSSITPTNSQVWCIRNKWCQLKWDLQHFCWNPENGVFSTTKSLLCHWSHVPAKNPSIHRACWRNCNSRNWRPWVLGKWNCAPSIGTGWNWPIGPGFCWMNRAMLERRASWFFCSLMFVGLFLRLGLMSFVLFLKNSFDSWMWGASFREWRRKNLQPGKLTAGSWKSFEKKP